MIPDKRLAVHSRRTMKPKSNYKPGPQDNCQTPIYAVEPILKFIPIHWHIWEPAAGQGNIVKALSSYGYNVTGTDILTGQDFFKYKPMAWDAVITNPPFSLKYRFLARCYQLGKPFALLLPLETLGAKAAQVLFKEFGIEIILLNKRVDFFMPVAGYSGKGAQFPTCWMTWGLNIGRQLTYANIIKRPDSQLPLFPQGDAKR